MAQTKILFFIADVLPSVKEKEIASKIDGKVCFRNAKFIDEVANLESCDFVLGKVPKNYKVIPFYGSKPKEENKIIKKDEEKKEEKKEETKSILQNIWKPN